MDTSVIFEFCSAVIRFIIQTLRKGVLIMEILVINGGKPLNGSITIGGMKNAALPVILASIVVDDG